MDNPVVHFEILGSDGSGLRWPHYGVMESDNGIGGAVGTADAVEGSAVLVYVEVGDPGAYVRRATALGATVALPVTQVPGPEVTIAWLRDPQGNLLGLVKSER